MKSEGLHHWNVSPKEAVQIQKNLRHQLILKNDFGKICKVCGCDAAFDLERKLALAGVIVYTWPDLKELERKSACAPLSFPYVPGLLSFREGPALLKAIGLLETEPDLYFFDGQGTAHPRGMGIASHMGLFLDKPSIGCAKSLLVGTYVEPGLKKGDYSKLLSKEGDTIGAVLRTRDGVRPLFISAGHRVSLKTALRMSLAACDGFRIPKPTRQADHFVASLKREAAYAQTT